MNAQKIRLENDTLFQKSQALGLSYVLDYEPERFLAPCYKAVGKNPSAIAYGGWESRQIQGHMLGHYLSALSGFYYQAGSEEAKEKLDYTVGRIKELQRKDGYFGGIPSEPFDKVFNSASNFEVERFSLAGCWVPWYSLHKIYAGLIDAYLYGKNEDALEIVKKMADWAIKGTARMSDASMQKMLTCEHGGMCKVFADLYGITGDKKYLKESERWIHKEIINPLTKNEDKLQGYHANTQIPKIIGLARLYELTGEAEYRYAAEFFFETVTKNRSYAIGGNSKGEHFGREFDEPLSRDTCESCNTYNMLELAEHIFAWNKRAEIADFYETALYNHILASQDPQSGAKTYFVSMQPGFHKVYCSHDNAMWCCTGTGLENPSRYNRFIACDFDDVLYINLFIPATVETEDGWKVKVETDFPYDAAVKIKVLEAGKGNKGLKVRKPGWADKMAEKAGEDGYIDFGNLSSESEIELSLPMKLSIYKAKDHSGNFAVKYGPLVLAADLGNEDLPEDIVDDHLIYMNTGSCEYVETVSQDLKSPEKWINLTDAAKLVFTMQPDSEDSELKYILRPFYDIHHVYYTVYFSSQKHEEDERTKAFSKITLDFIECGRQQSEIEHKYKTSGTKIGYLNEVDMNYRVFEGEDSYLSYKLNCLLNQKIKLVISLYAKDKGSISVKCGKDLIQTFEADGQGNGIKDIYIDLPQKAVKSKKDFVISGNSGMKIFEIRAVKAEN